MKLLAPTKTGRSSFLVRVWSLALVSFLIFGWGQASFAVNEPDGGGDGGFAAALAVPGDTDTTPELRVVQGIDALVEGDGRLVDTQPIEVEGELPQRRPDLAKESAQSFLDGLGIFFAKYGAKGVVDQLKFALTQNIKVQDLIEEVQPEGKYTVTVRAPSDGPESVALLNSIIAEMGLNNLVFAASEDPTFENPAALKVARPTKEFALFLEGLGEIFAKYGPVGVVQQIELALAQNKKLQGLIKLSESGGKYTVTVRVHPNAVESVTYLNQRFVEMGLSNLVFAASEDSNMEDPTALPRERLKLVQPLRIGLGVGVALAAATLSLPSLDIPAREFLIAGVPAMSVGVTSAFLELQFAARGMNKFWNKFFSGGPIIGRIKNIGVNIAYGMILYGAGMGASQLPTLWGGQPIPVDGQLALTAAVIQAAIQGVWFNAVMGQFQTDIGLQQRQGKLKAPRRYVLETFGVVINNSGRVLGWIIPGNLGTYAQAAFFFLQTLPKAAQTYLFDKATDARIYRAIHSEEKPAGSRWQRFVRSCANIVNPGH